MSHIYQIAFLDTQKAKRMEFFQSSARMNSSCTGQNFRRAYGYVPCVFRFKVKNIIDSQIDDLAVILNGNDLALGCKMLYSLREIEFQFCIYICFQKISERTQFISFRSIFNIACDKDDDCVIPLLPNPPGQIDTGSSTITKINIQKARS